MTILRQLTCCLAAAVASSGYAADIPVSTRIAINAVARPWVQELEHYVYPARGPLYAKGPDIYAQQMKLLTPLCTSPVARFGDVPELVNIRTGYRIAFGDIMHQLSIYSADAFDVQRRRVVHVSAPESPWSSPSPRTWFSEDPSVVVSCQLVLFRLREGEPPRLYVQVTQTTAVPNALSQAAEALFANPHRAQGDLGCDFPGTHLPPNEQLFRNGDELQVPCRRAVGSTLDTFRTTLRESAELNKVQRHGQP